MFEKLFDYLTSEKIDTAKLPIVILVLGSLISFFADRVPDTVVEKSIIQVAGFVVVFSGAILLLVSIMDKALGISTLTSISDGLISGLVASFLISAITFAPTDQFDPQNSFFYRIYLVLVYGMVYGGLLGLFSTFYEEGVKFDVIRSTTFILVVFLTIVYFISTYLHNKIPVVPDKPIKLGEIYIMHFAFIPIFIIIKFRSIKNILQKKFIVIFLSASAFFLFLMFVVDVRNFYNDSFFDGQKIWDMVFYIDYPPSSYTFGFFMVLFFAYTAISLIFAFRFSVGKEPLKEEPDREES